MPLIPGTQLGSYEIVTLLGAGGPAYARGEVRELRRGLAEAPSRKR